MNRQLPFLFMLIVAFVAAGCDGNNPPPSEGGSPSPPAGCSNTSVGLIPLNDLGPGSWRGQQGGLYPGGSNDRPVQHEAAGLAFASGIVPLDASGAPDPVSGKIGFVSIGMSNAQQEFNKLELRIEALPDKNPFLVVVNAAEGGWDINEILPPSAQYWSNVLDKIFIEGLTAAQVQVLWFKEAELAPGVNANDTTFPGYADELKEKFITVMHTLTAMFPNAHICYLASRIYGGYDTTDGNPEPFAYYHGWSVKRMIEDQINGNPALSYSGGNPVSPWLSWGTYLWADGLTPRSDGLTWICPDDFQPDGRHPSNPVGREKVAGLLLDYLMTDPTATPWLLEN